METLYSSRSFEDTAQDLTRALGWSRSRVPVKEQHSAQSSGFGLALGYIQAVPSLTAYLGGLEMEIKDFTVRAWACQVSD